MSDKAKSFIENLQHQLEENQKKLQENIELEKSSTKTSNLTLSNDKSLLSQTDSAVKLNNAPGEYLQTSVLSSQPNLHIPKGKQKKTN